MNRKAAVVTAAMTIGIGLMLVTGYAQAGDPEQYADKNMRLAAKDAGLAEREMVSHLFDVVRRIESNLKIDLNLETMCGVDLIHPSAKKNTAGRRLKPK